MTYLWDRPNTLPLPFPANPASLCVIVNLTDQLIRDEGLRLYPYKDTAGKLTIGVGRNFLDVLVMPVGVAALWHIRLSQLRALYGLRHVARSWNRIKHQQLLQLLGYRWPDARPMHQRQLR